MGSYLESTMESVLKNLSPGDEYFVIDGGSTDDSVNIIRSFESKLSGWVSESDSGYADALGKGFNMGSNSLMCWINSGDLMLQGSLDKVRQILSQGDVDFIFGDDFLISESSCVVQVSNGFVRDLQSIMLFGGWTPLQDACYWSRDLYQKVGGINTKLKYAADYDLFLRMSIYGRLRYIPMVFSAFRRHAGQISIANVVGYRAERMESRRFQLSKLPNKPNIFLFNFYYWFKVRWRAHFQSKKKKLSFLIGSSVLEIFCQSA